MPILTEEQLPSHPDLELSPPRFGVCSLGEPGCPFLVLRVSFPGLWPGKMGTEGCAWINLPSVQQLWWLSQGWPSSHRALVALLEGLAGTQSCCAHWDVSGYCANHLLFSVFPTCLEMGEEFVGVLGFRSTSGVTAIRE